MYLLNQNHPIFIQKERVLMGVRGEPRDGFILPLPLKFRYLLMLLSIAVSLLISGVFAMPLQHGKSLTPGRKRSLDIGQYFVSEKMDGIRGYWDGKTLFSRQGYAIVTPLWFIESLGDVPLDGEIWLGRGRFQEISALIARADVDDPLWGEVTYQIFDLPASKAVFKDRVALMQNYIPTLADNSPHVQMIPQIRVTDLEALDQQLAEVIKIGGEGLMLHYEDALYQPFIRHDQLLKVKHVDEGCAVVVGYTKGKGKYEGKVGALIVETLIDEDIKRFNLGSGLTDSQRAAPPEIGFNIPYLHNGYTDLGLPRFARLGKDITTCQTQK